MQISLRKPIHMQIDFLLPQTNISRQRPVQQSSLGEPSVVHEVEEDALAVVPHLHRYRHCDLAVRVREAAQGVHERWTNMC